MVREFWRSFSWCYQWSEQWLYNNCVKSLWKGKWTPKRIRNITYRLNNTTDSNAFTVSYITYDELQKIIFNLRNDCSSGHGNIHGKILKPVVDQVTSLIAHIINTSIDREIFPHSWKVARECPIPKINKPVTVRLSTNIYFTCFIQSIWKHNIESTTELHRKVCCLQPYPVWFS